MIVFVGIESALLFFILCAVNRHKLSVSKNDLRFNESQATAHKLFPSFQ